MAQQAALEGITVLDFGQIYNGPYATFLMAMAGARVIKVEPLTGETLRSRGTLSSAAYPFAFLNQNKESVTLNLKSDEGRELFLSLVEHADVVLENFAPDTMANLGLDADVVRGRNPRVIYASGSGYGREGAHRDYLAMDITVQAMAGVMSATGIDGEPPLKSGAAMCDFFGGVHLYGAIITSLFRRERTGEGEVLDVAMQDTVLPSLATVAGAYYVMDRKVPPRTGNKHPALSLAPYNVYPTSDGFVSMICIRDSHWFSLVKAMDRDDLIEDDALRTMGSRARNMARVDELVSAWTSLRTKHEVVSILQSNGVPVAPVRNIQEVLEDDHLHDRGMLHKVDHPQLGEISLPNSPINIASGHRVTPHPAPELGQHTDQILTELLSLTPHDLQTLRTKGVI